MLLHTYYTTATTPELEFILLLRLLLLNALRKHTPGYSCRACNDILFRGRCSRVVFIFEALIELAMGTQSS